MLKTWQHYIAVADTCHKWKECIHRVTSAFCSVQIFWSLSGLVKWDKHELFISNAVSELDFDLQAPMHKYAASLRERWDRQQAISATTSVKVTKDDGSDDDSADELPDADLMPKLKSGAKLKKQKIAAKEASASLPLQEESIGEVRFVSADVDQILTLKRCRTDITMLCSVTDSMILAWGDASRILLLISQNLFICRMRTYWKTISRTLNSQIQVRESNDRLDYSMRLWRTTRSLIADIALLSHWSNYVCKWSSIHIPSGDVIKQVRLRAQWQGVRLLHHLQSLLRSDLLFLHHHYHVCNKHWLC